MCVVHSWCTIPERMIRRGENDLPHERRDRHCAGAGCARPRRAWLRCRSCLPLAGLAATLIPGASALASAVPCARLHARAVLWEWGLTAFHDTACLILSELTTNAVAASAGLNGSRYDGRWTPGTPPIRFWLCSDRQRVMAAVWDASHHRPTRAAPDDPEADHGRGLLLVETLSEKWGVQTRGSGKVVWAVMTQ
jgi:hypothetical protein